MRVITPAALAAIQNSYGEEPITIIEISWATTGPPKSYADKTVAGIPGKILELGNLDSILDITRSNTSQSIDFSIEDTDGSIKSIIDTQDIHHVPVNVYQYFTGLDVDTDKFLVFSGKINAPFTWSETSRTLSFQVLSEIENLEFGFSPEEGEIPGLPANLVGKAWPSIFGTAIDVPTVNIGQTVTGTTLCGVGLLEGKNAYLEAPLGGDDCGFYMSLARMSAQISHNNRCGAAAGFGTATANDYIDQSNQIRAQIAQQVAEKQRQQLCAARQRQDKLDEAEEQGLGCNPLRVLGGEDFPQGSVLTLDVGGLTLTGVMNGQDFDIHTRTETKTKEDAELAERRLFPWRFGIDPCDNRQQPQPQYWELTCPGPTSPGQIPTRNPTTNLITGYTVQNLTSTITSRGFVYCTGTFALGRPTETSVLKNKFVEAGARVSIVEGDDIAYIVSITPGTVLDIKAYKQFEGDRRLVSIPPTYYTVTVESYGTFNATVVRMTKALSSRVDEGWGDEVFATFESTIGPNPVDILDYIIDRYTDLTIDAASFAAVRPDVDITPMNFAVLDRPNTLDLVKELVFQCRCATYTSGGTIFLKFLPKEPTADEVITVSNVSLGSVEVTTESIEQLATKLVAKFNISYAEDEQKIILRNNVSKYGTQEREFDFFAYNNAKVVYHVATFWLIRLSNLWKRLRFSGFLDLMRLETFDTVELALPPYVANGNILAVVNAADYSSADNQIQFEVEVPVTLGNMEQHPLYWPQNSTLEYPTAFDTAPGGGGLGADASGTLPVGVLDGTPFAGLLPQTVAVGGPNAAYGPRSDRGDRRPGDTGFNPGNVTISSSFANVDNTPAPNLDLELDYLDDIGSINQIDQVRDQAGVDIRTTPITDALNPGRVGVLGDFIYDINADNRLVINTGALITDGVETGPFDFKWDADDEEWGAGTAFFEDA